MSGRYGIGRLSESKEFPAMQRKLEDLYDNYNHSSNSSNLVKCSEIIEQNANVQKKLVGSLNDIASEGPYECTRSLVRSSYWPYSYYYSYYPYSYYYPYHYSSTASVAAAAAAAAAAAGDLAVQETLVRKNAQISDISYHYEKEVSELESELNSAKLNNCELKTELTLTKDQLDLEKKRAETVTQECKSNLEDLKSHLKDAESKLSLLEPKAELAQELEKQISSLKDEIKHVRTTNAILADHNDFQAKIIRSRPVSPVVIHCSRPASPVLVHYSRSCSPVSIVHHRHISRPVSPCSVVVARTSPLSPSNCTQVIRQNSLVSRFDDLYSRNRVNAMDILRSYTCDHENNQRIIFAAVQEAFSVAKRTFLDWKIRVRSTVACSHRGPETLEEAVQHYINRNVDLYDLPYMTSEVVSGLRRNPKISLPCGVSYTCINSFIREACRIAWEMSALAYPLDTAFALDGDVFDDFKYRRSYDSEYSAPLVSYHVWPCLQQGCQIVSKGEAVTKRGCSTALVFTRCHSPLRTTTTTTTTTIIRSRSPSPVLRRSRSCYFRY